MTRSTPIWPTTSRGSAKRDQDFLGSPHSTKDGAASVAPFHCSRSGSRREGVSLE
jgi:hypothetical protein